MHERFLREKLGVTLLAVFTWVLRKRKIVGHTWAKSKLPPQAEIESLAPSASSSLAKVRFFKPSKDEPRVKRHRVQSDRTYANDELRTRPTICPIDTWSRGARVSEWPLAGSGWSNRGSLQFYRAHNVKRDVTQVYLYVPNRSILERDDHIGTKRIFVSNH